MCSLRSHQQPGTSTIGSLRSPNKDNTQWLASLTKIIQPSMARFARRNLKGGGMGEPWFPLVFHRWQWRQTQFDISHIRTNIIFHNQRQIIFQINFQIL